MYLNRTASVLSLALVVCGVSLSRAQTLSTVQGRVLDASGAPLSGATIDVRDPETGFHVFVRSDDDGRYAVFAIPAGTYTVTVAADGFRSEVIQALAVDVGRVIVRDFRLALGMQLETVVVGAEAPLIDRASATLGYVITTATIQQVPVNGRHFTDLALLVPGSLAPSQSGFSSRPSRGTGALAINTGGNREEAVGFLVNGVSTNNLTFGSLVFEPPLASVQEFKVDAFTFAPEYGHVSGAVVNIVTRSGSDRFRGELFEFFRDDVLDARNFFEVTEPAAFRRHQFGGTAGGPIRRGRTFFFAAYEGLRQRHGVTMNSLVLSDDERAAARDPIVRQLIPLIPRANVFDADGTARFVGWAPAAVDTDRWTVDIRHALGDNDRLHAFYGRQRVRGTEPSSQGNSIPGFGQLRKPFTSVLTVGHTHIFGSGWLHDAHAGRSILRGGSFPAAPFNPADFGIHNGVTRAIGLPQFIVAGDLNFGGPGILPQGRDDSSHVLTETLTRTSGRHAVKAGGEYRHFINDNFAEGTGILNFPTVEAFLDGVANAFSITLGERRSIIDQRAAAAFLQDTVTLGDRLSLELGLRYEWHVTPSERDDKLVVFDARRATLVRAGIDADTVYGQNNRNLEPRVGVVWNIAASGRTVVRAAYAHAADQPTTTAVRDLAANPPFAAPLTATGAIYLGSALDATRPGGLAPATIDPDFRNASLRSWNVNLQRQFARDLAATIGYAGSRGRDLRIARNINQPVDGVRPFAAVAASSAILPGTPLGNITQVESSGFSAYHAGWIAVTKRLARGVQFDTSYTLSRSLDTNSLNSSGFAVQNSYDITGQYGLSDFDARHRFVFSGTYLLPFHGHVLTRGWQLAADVQSQSGNPVNIVTSGSMLTGMPNSVRPDLIGPIRIIGAVDRWFDPRVFVAVNRFGNLARNAVIGPPFHITNLSVIRNIRPADRVDAQVRVDIFNAFNQANLGPPGNIVGSPAFGKITRTRLPTGEAGSSRQIQLAAKVSF